MGIWSTAVGATIPAVIAIVFALGRRFLPARVLVQYGAKDEQRFARLQWRMGLAMIVVGAIFVYLSFSFLIFANHFLAASGDKVAFVLLPGRWMFMFFPLFGSLTTCWEITLRLWKRFGNSSQAMKYESWSNQRLGFDGTQLLRVLILCLVVPIGIATLLAVPLHASIGEAGFHISHFGSFKSVHYSFSAVRRVLVTDALRLRDGSLQRRPAILVYFSDGTHWSSADNRDPDLEINKHLLKFILDRTHLPVEHVVALPFGAA